MNLSTIEFSRDELGSSVPTSHRITIIISGDRPELMINERIIDHDGEQMETVQVSQDVTESLYRVLHNIYSAKS